MKNKGFTYLLLAVVGIVWYQVFVRIKSNLETEATEVPQTNSVLISSRKVSKPKSFELQANFRDPFLTGTKVSVSSNVEINPTLPNNPKPQPVVIKKEPVYWPSIKYYGFVRNTHSKSPRVIVSIDKSIFKLQVGEEVLDNVKILSATNDFVKISYQKEIRVFEK